MRVLFDARPGDACATGIGRYTRTISAVLAAGVPGHQTWSLGHDVAQEAGTAIEEELELPELLDREAIDVLHSPLWRLPALLPCRSVITIHDAIPVVRPDLADPAFAPLFASARDAAERAYAVVCPSEHAKRDVVSALGVAESKVHVIPEHPAPHFQRITPDASALVYARHGIERAFILVVGSVERRKNPIAILEALRILGRAAPLAIFAGPLAGFPLLEEAARLGVSEHVRALGLVSDEDLVALMNEAKALVFPSLYEGFGLPIVEAFACGTPVVASNAASIPEVAGDAASFFDPTKPDELAATLERVLGSPALREELSKRGTERLHNFTKDQVRSSLARLYSSVEARAA